MTQRELHRALSHATGESVGRIRRLGFSLVNSALPQEETELQETAPQFVDWDAVDAERMALAIIA